VFIGHYAPAGPASAIARDVKLWHAFAAVQFLDLLWAPFILLGIEEVRIEPGFTAANPFDLRHMPYTHSLPMAAAWSVLAAAAFRYPMRKSAQGAVIVGLLVFSHWLADLVVHAPDLPLWFGGPKAGFGLWNVPWVSIPLEFASYAAAIGAFVLGTRPRSRFSIVAPATLFLVGCAFQAIGSFGPPPPSPEAAARSALAAFAALIGLAAWADAARSNA